MATPKTRFTVRQLMVYAVPPFAGIGAAMSELPGWKWVVIFALATIYIGCWRAP